MGETAAPRDADHEPGGCEVAARWAPSGTEDARSWLTALVTRTEAVDEASDTASRHLALQELVAQLRTLTSQERHHPLMTDDQVVTCLVQAIRHAVRLTEPGLAVGLAEAVTVVAQDLGPSHPHTLTARFALADAYRAAGHVQQAVTLSEQVVEGSVQLLGPDDPSTLTARACLASAYRAAGRTGLAVRTYEDLAVDAARLLGPSHPDALSARNNLAQAYESAGDTQRALALYDNLVRDAGQVLGPQHPYLAVFLRNRERARNRGNTEDGDEETSTEAGRDA
ncbi:tetratricopeptide repeat protein [Actinomyces sp. 2119]|uniref:Tetratricopeptide repeat protein n=1 Tax=Actinomyces lilanjuaniae TaxID=2321394 RepID=A0ABM6Z5G2_9ACTO|nr:MULTISPECIES: tetratricopeptide repeat protein [Actinomyces]AYD90346.1 tetratricopeptide repeat protein [Actinomyces lilanjuaniae]RJF40920.1 tetratricopeptide repeat protein [Actinomyces sp. 2119]